MLTNRLLAGPRTATNGVDGARRRALEAGRNMVGMRGSNEWRAGDERKEGETGSMEERDRHQPVELGKKPVELERMKSRERDVELWPEAESYRLANQRPGLLQTTSLELRVRN